jgi:hypothetical protein
LRSKNEWRYQLKVFFCGKFRNIDELNLWTHCGLAYCEDCPGWYSCSSRVVAIDNPVLRIRSRFTLLRSMRTTGPAAVPPRLAGRADDGLGEV